MKKLIEKVFCVVGLVLFVWFMASWIDIVADNCEPNPHHYDWNLFVIATKDYDAKHTEVEQVEVETYEAERVEDGMCGSPLQDNIRMTTATVSSVQGDCLSLVDEDGEEWFVEVGYGENFEEGDWLLVFFDDMGTEYLYDDEVVKLWSEVW